MASIIIVMIACSRSIYKASLKRRNRKRDRECFAAYVQPANHRRTQPRCRRRILSSQNDGHDIVNNNNNLPFASGETNYDANRSMIMLAGDPLELTEADLQSLARASTTASEPGVGGRRRRMSDESTLAEFAREGEWAARA